MPLNEDLLSQVGAAIRRRELLIPGQTVVVGVSGGPDSLTLLHLLQRLGREMPLALHVAHVDHGLRGEESSAAARLVAGRAEAAGLPYHGTLVDTASCAQEQGLSVEAAARRLRFQWFEAVAARVGAQAVAVAHTLDDQIETVLFRLVRGAAGPGMLGIRWARRLSPEHPGVRVIHPLLGVRREQVVTYCRDAGIAWCEDSSNQDPSFARNVLRHQVMPHLLALNPQLHQTVQRNLELLADEEAWIEGETEEALRRVLGRQADSWELDRKALASLPPALQRRVLYRVLREFGGAEALFNAAHLEDVRDLFGAARGGGEVHLPHALVARREGDIVRLLPRQVQVVPEFAYGWEAERPLMIPELACRVSVERLPAPPPGLVDLPPSVACFAADTLPQPLVWRNWRPGDRIAPWGAAGHRKVARWLADRRIPRRERSRVLLLAHGSEILWIAGHRRSRLAPLGAQTSEVLRVRIEGAL